MPFAVFTRCITRDERGQASGVDRRLATELLKELGHKDVLDGLDRVIICETELLKGGD